MSDSVNFGPKWLRNMSNDTGNSSLTTSSTIGGNLGGSNAAYNNSSKYLSIIFSFDEIQNVGNHFLCEYFIYYESMDT